MKILNTEVIARGVSGKRCWLTLQERTVEDAKGKPHRYFFASRTEAVTPAENKRPDAVVIVAFVGEGDEKRLLLTDEYRIPLGRREIGFPAGLIDPADYQSSDDMRGAACRAAIREFKEETGMDFTPCEVSPPNLYSSAGMTDESICVVIGYATGTQSREFLEEHEDIHSMLLTRPDIIDLMDNRPDVAFGKIAWPFLWSIKHNGFPK